MLQLGYISTGRGDKCIRNHGDRWWWGWGWDGVVVGGMVVGGMVVGDVWGWRGAGEQGSRGCRVIFTSMKVLNKSDQIIHRYLILNFQKYNGLNVEFQL